MATEATSQFSQEQFDNPYPDGIQHHYWTAGRHRILARALRDARGPDETLLDIGCGRGITVDYLRAHGFQAYGCEVGTPAPITAAAAPFLLLNTDVRDVPGEIKSRVTTILLLDVLEHLQEPLPFLESCLSLLPRCRRVLVTVPARTELWSNYDTYYGHVRRYDLASIGGLVPGGKCRVVRCGYFFHALYLPGLLLKLLRRPRGLVIAPPAPSARGLHALVGACFDWEYRLAPSRILGTSMLMLLEVTAR